MILKRGAVLPGILAAGCLLANGALAGDVEIVSATAKQSAGGWTISVTLRHGDTGWDHYADLWAVYTPDGMLLGRRELAHPHVNEQPFTRSLSGVDVPEGVDEVVIKARDSVHGVSPQDYRLELR